MKHRVVVTGMSAITPIGTGWEEISTNLKLKKSGVQVVPFLDEITGMRTRLGALLPNFETPKHYKRKKLRTVGKVALYAIRATELALEQADLIDSPLLSNGTTGVSFGSTSGASEDAISYMTQVSVDMNIEKLKGSTYTRFMSHTCAANISQYFQTRGRVIPTCSACTSGSQGVGFAFETIQNGYQDIMISGGAEEYDKMSVSTFDVLFATSTKNDSPEKTPRPFDKSRDGLVVGEGASTLILESLESAQKRNAPILAEIIGFATNSDGVHMVNPSRDGMERVMNSALDNANITQEKIDFVSAHGTSTEVGDIAETTATEAVFNREVPISSLKSYMGHSLGACGAIESFVTISQMNEGWIAPTINLDTIDDQCGKLDYVRDIRKLDQEYVMSNNFAFGGVNTSLIFKRWSE